MSERNIPNDDFKSFQNTILNLLNKYVPIKKKYIRRNNSAFVDKAFRKEIMKRSRLFNTFKKKKNKHNWMTYATQRNLCLSLLRKRKKIFYNNLDVKKITDNKKFWKTVKPCFSDKYMKDERITLIEENEVISDDKSLAKVFNNYFGNIIKKMNIKLPREVIQSTEAITDSEDKAIKKFVKHPSIIKIKESIEDEKSFSFSSVSLDEIKKEINLLDKSKACQETDIPVKIIKENSDIFAKSLLRYVNHSMHESLFPEDLKKADISPIFKKESRSDKVNYRPISILPNISKIFERCIYNQLCPYFDSILSPFQCGFRKGYNAQYCLIAMVENWKKNT